MRIDITHSGYVMQIGFQPEFYASPECMFDMSVFIDDAMMEPIDGFWVVAMIQGLLDIYHKRRRMGEVCNSRSVETPYHLDAIQVVMTEEIGGY